MGTLDSVRSQKTVKQLRHVAPATSAHTIGSSHGTSPGVKTPIPGINGPVALLLLLLSIAVVTVALDRGRYWWQWWRTRASRRQQWERLLAEQGPPAAGRKLEDWDLEMRFGEPLLQAAVVLAPLLGLVGTVLGLMQVLASLGPQLLLPAGANLAGFGQVLLSTAIGLIVSLIAGTSLVANQWLRRSQCLRLQRLGRSWAAQP
ncbi:MAG: MotA/TolQ/ExbB proton channel family protein [Aphanothece saxicola GSE-SYN-MK-01-06B]|jgi:biopolymer transport protein ExbB|nr:MotA/TolQ/ExbB proton channel family protein [Aphanothece saxicola GSE-SYN-MK-01-06B]